MSEIFRKFVAKVAKVDDGKIAALDFYLDNMVDAPTPVKDDKLVIQSWDDLHTRMPSFTEEDLRALINYESATTRRMSLIERMHMRFCKMRDARERVELLSGQIQL